MTRPHNTQSSRILILAPQGRDAEIARALLEDADLAAVVVPDLSELVQGLVETAGTVVVTEEAVRTADLAPLRRWITMQPAWSDMPFILLTRQGGVDRNPAAARLSGVLGNVSFLERPFHPTTLISVVVSALRGRRRQYEARARVEELHAREGELRELNATLESRIAEAIDERAIAEGTLRQAQKMEAVGQLTGGLAHDFNNLLAGISGALELIGTRLTQGRLNDIDKYMVAAQGATKRAAALTHRLLAFSRRQTLDPRPTNVNALVNGMTEMIQRTVGPGISVETVGAASLWPALVDASQLENALLNLCINARDAMPEGGRITIETANKWLDRNAARTHDVPEGQYLSLCVTDTGSGMTVDVIAKAFDPFFTTKPLGQGTGLGLSMIYGFAKQSGGQVRIYSEVDEGTTVCIYLPRHYGEAATSVDGPDKVPIAFADAGVTVLIVDDEPTVRMLVTDVLEDLGYTVIEAGDSAAGLKVLRSDVRIDLLITDVGLPGGMNGRQMADAGRELRAGLRILFITGYAENAALGHGHLQPGMQVLTKPFAVDTIAARVRELVAT